MGWVLQTCSPFRHGMPRLLPQQCKLLGGGDSLLPMTTGDDVLEALAAEGDQLEALLGSLSEGDWAHPSGCSGWSVSDVVLHLAQTEEAVVATVGGGTFDVPAGVAGNNVDEIMAGWVEAQRGVPGSEVFSRWRDAHRSAIESLRGADPSRPVAWAAAPLKPRTLATTRLSEHWIHAQDIAEPLQADYPDSDRLWHIARLAHRTVPYAYARAGRDDPPSLRLELTSPGGEQWTLGEPDADVQVRGSASAFCRVAGRRLPPDEARLEAEGERAGELLSLVRTYA